MLFTRAYSRKCASAFTVVELLVVMAVIAVLFSMILPVMNGAMASAKQVRCAANMKQVYAAMIAYAADHDSFFPITPAIGSMGDNSLAYWMLPANGGAGQIDFEHGQLWQYIDPHNKSFTNSALTSTVRYQIFNCPADDGDSRLVAWNSIGLLKRNFSYSFNAEVRQRPVGGSMGWRTGVRLSEIVNPSIKIVTVEEQWPNDAMAFLGWIDESAGNFKTANPTVMRCDADVFSARHRGLGNQGFADGHVEAIDPRTLGFNIFSLEFGTTSGPTNYDNLAAAKALDLFYR